jgi:TatD DNase family protein
VRYVPRDRLLLETDAPYLTPAPHRGKTNTPALIRHTYAAVAEMLGLTDAALAVLVAANAQSLFAVVD